MKTHACLRYVLIAVFLSCLAGPFSRAQEFFEIETGGVFSGYNDLRIPGDTGTSFSLVDDLETPAAPFLRFRAGYNFNPRHTVLVLIAPLSLNASGSFGERLSFNGVDFPADTPLETLYKFNSYRLTYRYTLIKKENFRFAFGFTAKIRDAEVKLEGGGRESSKTNVGFVPLLHFLLEWRFSQPLSLLLEGDALAAPQGRAEDVLLALVWRLNKNVAFRAGYRVLEGGADNDEVYSFALLHYLVVGAGYYF